MYRRCGSPALYIPLAGKQGERMRTRNWIVLTLAIAASACSSNGSNPGDGDAGDVANVDASLTAIDGASGADANTTSNADAGTVSCPQPSNLNRGRTWVRNNRMFISGLMPGMPDPSSAQVGDYFDTFGATAAHFWEDGLPGTQAAWATMSHPNYRFLSWTHSDGTIVSNGQVVGGVPNLPGRIGYQIGDEPVTMADFNEHMGGVTAVRNADPDALIVFNFTTSRAQDLTTQLAVASASADVDVLSYDLYTYTQDAYEALSVIRDSALASNKVYWRYLNSFHDITESGSSLTESDMRWDAFVGLVYGFTGHSWFVYQIGAAHGMASDFFTGVGDFGSTKTNHFNIAADLNRQMAHVGRVLTQLVSTDVRYIPAQSYLQPDGTQNWSAGAGGDDFITNMRTVSNEWHEMLAGFFSDDCGDTYVMLQNANHTDGNFPTVLDQDETIRVDFDFSSAPAGFDKTAVDVFNKTNGTVTSVSLSGTGDARSLEFTLVPGDIYFFKYRTGRPFAIQP